MTDTPSTAGLQAFGHLGPLPHYLADSPRPDFTDRLERLLNDETARARDVPCAKIATRFWGDPTSTASKEWRWGTRGSRSVNLEKNVWFDHEANEGGNTIQLVERELNISHEAATAWLLDPNETSETGGLSPNSPRGNRPPPPLGRIVASYDYLDESGTLLSQVVRYEPKNFRQRRPHGRGGWSWSVKGVRAVPYRLPDLLKAIADGRTIAIVEGEKDVDALYNLGFSATCNAGGAKKWRRELTPYLRGADVVVIPDNDVAGREHANVVGFALENVAAQVRILNLPGLPEKADVSDWFAAGHTTEELSQLIAEAPRWTLRAPFRQPDSATANAPEASVEQSTGPAAAQNEGSDEDPTGNAEHRSSDQARSEGAHQQWPNPHPLPHALLQVHPFSLELMPSRLRPWVSDVSERMQCPPDFVAVSVMAGIGSVIGRRIALRPQAHNDWQIFANQWAMIIGRPGVLKSPAMEEALRPLKRLAAAAEDTFRQAQAEHAVRAKIAKLRSDGNMKEAARRLKRDPSVDVSDLLAAEELSQGPTLRRYIANDTNVASLGVLLQQNPNGLLVFRDEFVSLLDHLDREENVSEHGFYLTAWNGDSGYTFDRIGRGLHLSIEGICLSLLGSSQPGRISQYLHKAVRGGLGDDGLIQRFGLMIWPDVHGEWKNIDRFPDSEARIAAFETFKQLDELDWRAIGGRRDHLPNGDEDGPPYLRFGIEAHDLFVEWRTRLEKRVRGGDNLHPALESHLAKYRKLVPGLALACHLVDDCGSAVVGVAALQRALAWAKYLETHAQRAYGSVTGVSVITAQAIVAKIRSGHLKLEFRSHDVWRPGWSKLTDRIEVQAALDLLVDYDWLQVRRILTAGRPASLYAVNPKILKN
jgi:hypothetical protein